MSDLGFAIDGLYACGWWPSDGDRCRQHSDGRWYPAESLILDMFAQRGIRLYLCQSDLSSAVEVAWGSADCGRQSVHGRTRVEAMILAFTAIYKENHAVAHLNG